MKLFLAYLIVYLGGAAFFLWAFAHCFGCDGPSLESHEQHIIGIKFYWSIFFLGWTVIGFIWGIALLIRIALAAWAIRFAAKNWQAGKDQYRRRRI